MAVPNVKAVNAFNPHFIQAFLKQKQKANPEFIGIDSAPALYPPIGFIYKSTSPATPMVNFYPVYRKGSNYLRYCTGLLSEREKPNVQSCVREYTSGDDWSCTTINMALASDSITLRDYGTYIKELKYSISVSPIWYSGIVMRGVDMSRTEIAKYESNSSPFFIPSFTSTSKSKPFDKNTVITIDISPQCSKYCMEIPRSCTDFQDEEEILISCYNLYCYEKTEKSNGKRYIRLRLLNHDKYYDSYTNSIRL